MTQNFHMPRHLINYSQSWEDPNVLLEALNVQPDDRIISITSGGDNSLALLLKKPQVLVSVDKNPAQNYLLELKYAAASLLSFENYHKFVGVVDSCTRLEVFLELSEKISLAAKQYWLSNTRYVRQGIIHCGRFERFVTWFPKYVLPLVHSKKTVNEFLALQSIKDQENFFNTKWNSWRWRFLFRIASNRFVLKKYARGHGMFSYATEQNVAHVYEQRLKQLLTTVPIRGNFFLAYSLTGHFVDSLPPYLQKNERAILKESFPMTIVSASLLEYLKSTPDNSFSKFNLSDIFEALSVEENDSLWHEIVRTARPGAKVAYWTNLVARSYPDSLTTHIRDEKNVARRLHAVDRVFFYGAFRLHTILK